MKDARIALQRGGMKDETDRARWRDAAEAMFRRLQRDAPHEAVNLVAVVEEMFGEIAAVLAGDAGDQRRFPIRSFARGRVQPL